MNVRQYIARTAIWSLIESHQGNAVLDDGLWDELHVKNQGNLDAMARDAIKILRDIRSTLADLGIPRNDPDLISLWKKGLDEISKRTEENDEGGLDV